MATIHLIGGEKGGVGKSVVARLLAQYMIDENIAFVGFDTDRSHGALLRYYADYAAQTAIDHFESLDAIIENAAAHPDRNILVDLAAQTQQPLTKWLEESGVLELAQELDITMQYWHVMDSGKDSVDLLGKLLATFGDTMQYVLVLNQARDDNFSLLLQSPAYRQALEFGAKIVNIKRLYAPVMSKIDGLSLSFWAAKNKAEDSDQGLGLLERQRLKIWLSHAYKEIASAGV